MEFCKHGNLKIQDFLTDIQQAEEQHRNILQEMSLNIRKGTDRIEHDSREWSLQMLFHYPHFQVRRTGLGWYWYIMDSPQA